MKRIRHNIRRKQIPIVKLVSTTSKNWYASDGSLIPWSGLTDGGPSIGDVVQNLSGNTQNGLVSEGYYKYSGTTPQWVQVTSNGDKYDDLQLPIPLLSSVDEWSDDTI